MGLSEFFIATVSSEDGMETVAQRFLGAAIKLGRPPDHCVTFVPGSLAGVTAAHNCTMKVRHLAVGYPVCGMLEPPMCPAQHSIIEVAWEVLHVGM